MILKSFLHSRMRLGIALLATVALGSAVTWFSLIRDSDENQNVHAENYSGRQLICLARDSSDEATAQYGEEIWRSVQEAVNGKQVNLQRLDVPLGGRGGAPYLTSLVNRKCKAIFVVGKAFDRDLPDTALRNPGQEFIVPADSAVPLGQNIAKISNDAGAIPKGEILGFLGAVKVE